ncbi:MAG: bifunctional methylenetetrahydrofolate dehydrogenase/methenyltetrahydrofolate cyclohydrolase FolD [Desulfovibrio sp.]|nr:bifunctional methylenetetrahydrofolate dehydrogenase/methenyltetrahydrofolate cyclohydrolase FolD [Desulfovibrio sp.]
MGINKLLDGKALASELRAEMATEVRNAVAAGARPPGLAVILVGDDAASQVYVRNKQRACAEVGIVSVPFLLPVDTSEAKLQALIADLNGRPDIDGILLQLPLPEGLDSRACLDAIAADKDVDGFHPANMGKLALGLPGFAPCTPLGVLELLKRNNIELDGKKAVIVGRSNIVGKPLAMLLGGKDANATVTLCHSGTRNLKEECLKADILLLAVGRPKAITADMIPDGCVVVDIGVNRLPDGLCGDVDFEGACAKASAITPVPGGVGPMTIAMLLANTLKSWRERLAQEKG